MDKDIIYIDPADDITDIISKIKEAKEKAVALVPPKKSSVLHSSVNFKLIAKTAKTNKKDISLITTDDSLKHLAASTSIPVASNVKATATVPEMDDAFAKPEPTSKVIEAPEEDEEEAEEETSKKAPKKSEKAEEKTPVPVKDLNSTSPRREKEKKDKDKKGATVPNFNKYRKWIILGAIVLLGLIGFLIWALAFAPGVTIEAKVRTTSHNLSKDVSFVTDEKQANPKEGVFLLKEETHTEKGETEFNATGEKDKGKKASGSLTLKRTSPVKARVSGNKAVADPITISAGTRFTYNGLVYIAKSNATLNGATFNNPSSCPGPNTFDTYTCNLTSDVTATISVEAENAGERYNGPSGSGWASGSGWVVSGASVSGGSTEVVKVVTDQDIKNAESNIKLDADTDKIEKELYAKFDDDSFVLDNSFGVSEQKTTSTPALGQEASGNTKPKLQTEITYHVMAVSRKDLDAYIKAQIQADVLKDQKGQKIYATGVEKRAGEKKNRKNPKDQAYFQSIEKNDKGYTARLKTVAETGLTIDEQGILKKVLGKKIGEAKAQIEEQDGIVDVKVKSNFFWVNSVPNDANRVKIKVTIKED